MFLVPFDFYVQEKETRKSALVRQISIDANQILSDDVESGISNLICTCHKPVMVPAGTLVHLVPTSAHNYNKNKSLEQITHKESIHPRYVLKIIDDVTEFSDIKVCPNLLSDHDPQAYINGLRDVADYYANSICII